MSPHRRNFLLGLVAGAALPQMPAFAQAVPQVLRPTPSCVDDDEPTLQQSEGPFFTPNSPNKRNLAADSPGGIPFLVGGLVVDTSCTPIPNALIEIWQTDENGEYDAVGYRMRGHQTSNADGAWWFETILPGLYPGRTRHFHFKVQRADGTVLTTQLYFPGEPGNDRDRIFDARLLLETGGAQGDRFGRYDFVLA